MKYKFSPTSFPMLSFCYLQAKGINDLAGCIIFVKQVKRAITRCSRWLVIVLMVTNNQGSLIFILIGIQNYFFLTSFFIYSVICKHKEKKTGQEEQFFWLASKCCDGNKKMGEYKLIAGLIERTGDNC